MEKESKPRDCVKIIEEMLSIIPESEEELIIKLLFNKTDAMYKAPEETIQWVRTSETLQYHIPIPKEEWEFKVLSIFTTLSIEQIKSQTGNSKNNE